MSDLAAKTIMLTTLCSAGCSHCPFSNPGLESLFLDLEFAQKIITESGSRLIVISGGEPFEHPKIAELLVNLLSQSNPFRIATGGFINLYAVSKHLVDLARLNPSFQGLSMGTDVLTSRCSKGDLQHVWLKNIQLLNQLRVPYSITFTLGTDVDPNLVKKLSRIKCVPSFFYLRHRGQASENRNLWREIIKESFPGVTILEDFIIA